MQACNRSENGGVTKRFDWDTLWIVDRLMNMLICLQADAMGLGKTIQTVSLFAYLWERKGVKGPHLIVAPLSTLRTGWSAEFDRWFPQATKVVYEGSRETRRVLRSRWLNNTTDPNFSILLTTDAFIMKDKSYLRKFNWEYLVVDEAHR